MPEGQKNCYKYSGNRSVDGFEGWVSDKRWNAIEGKEIATSKSIIEEMMPSAESIQNMINKFLS